MPRVAVIIPCHNDGALALEAIGSIDEREPVEVIVVDDGSTEPRTLACLQAIERSGVTVIRQPGAGPGPARNAGVLVARSDLVFALDADDRLRPGSLAALADALESNPGAAFAFGDFVRFGDGASGRWRAPAWSPWLALYANWWSVSACYRRKILLGVGGWPAGDYEDWALYLTLAEHGHCGIRLDRVVWEQRIHGVRRQAAARRQHRRRYRALRSSHRDLFADKPRLRRAARPPLWQVLVFPLVLGSRPMMPAWLERRLLALRMRRAARTG